MSYPILLRMFKRIFFFELIKNQIALIVYSPFIIIYLICQV